jgi:hypothetical protein
MIVFGGRCFEEDVYGVHETCLNDTHILDLTSMRWLPTSLNPADFQHSAAARSGQQQQQQQQQRSVYETSGFLEPIRPLRGLNLGYSETPSEYTGSDKPGNFGSVDSGHGSMEPSRLAASLAALTPADMSFQAAQFSQSRREVSLDAPVMRKGVGEVVVREGKKSGKGHGPIGCLTHQTNQLTYI